MTPIVITPEAVVEMLGAPIFLAVLLRYRRIT